MALVTPSAAFSTAAYTAPLRGTQTTSSVKKYAIRTHYAAYPQFLRADSRDNCTRCDKVEKAQLFDSPIAAGLALAKLQPTLSASAILWETRFVDIVPVTVTQEPGGRVLGEAWAKGDQYVVREATTSFGMESPWFLENDGEGGRGWCKGVEGALLFSTRASAARGAANRAAAVKHAMTITIYPVTTTEPREVRVAGEPLK